MAFEFNDTLNIAVKHDIKANKVPMLLGEPGIGKSSYIKDLAADLRTKCFTVNCNQLAEKADLTGARLIPSEKKDGNYMQKFFPHYDINAAIEYAESHPRENPILFLDEINRTTSDVTSAALSISTDRKIGSITLPKNIRIITAGNDKGNITALDTASVSRFVLYHVKPSLTTFLAVNSELNPFIKNVLMKEPDCLYCTTIPKEASSDKDDDDEIAMTIDDIINDGEEMTQFTTPRTITALSEWLNLCDNKELMTLYNEVHIDNGVETTALQEIIEGHVGYTKFTVMLMAEIATGITTNLNNQSAVKTLTKPSCYDDLKKCSSIDSLNAFINTMTAKDKSNCLIYLIYEAEDNRIFIEQLAKTTTSLTPEDIQAMMNLYMSQKLDDENLQTLIDTQTTVGTLVSTLTTTNIM